MKKITSSSLIISSLSCLIGCGGGGTSSDINGYQTLDSTASTSSTLGGVVLRSNGNTGKVEVLNVSGTTTHNTGRTTISDGTYSLTDPDGFNGGTTLSDGVSTIISDGSQGFGGEYEYVTAYEQSYTANGVSFDSFGIGGIVTSEADIVDSGSATYVGESVGLIITSTTGFDLTNGQSSVQVDFGNQSVDVILSNFTSIDQLSGLPASAPIDEIAIDGMSLVQNRIENGTILLRKNGISVDITGVNTTTSSSAVFFGSEALTDFPDEIGGLFYLKGNDGVVLGQFIAD